MRKNPHVRICGGLGVSNDPGLPDLKYYPGLVLEQKEMEPVPSTVTKTYPKRGPLQQFRFIEATAFRCFRCSSAKKSKLITVYSGDWSRKLCNGCFRSTRQNLERERKTSEPNSSATHCFRSSQSTNNGKLNASLELRTTEQMPFLLRPCVHRNS